MICVSNSDEGKYLINPALVLFIVVTNDNSNKVFFHDKIVTVDNASLEVLTANFNWIQIYDSHNDMCYLNEKKISAVFIEDRRMFFLFDGEKFERSFPINEENIKHPVINHMYAILSKKEGK